MRPKPYLIVLKDPEKYGSESDAIAADHIHDVTGEPAEVLKRGVDFDRTPIDFDDDADFIYYDGGEDGYVAKSDIKAIIDVKELIGENVDSVDDRFKIAPEDVQPHPRTQD